MGGFNTYPAMNIENVKSPMDSYAKAMQLKQLSGEIKMQPGQLELQQQQIETQKRMLADKEAETKAMKQWSENPGQVSMDELPNLILKNGGSADSALKWKSQLLAQQKDIETWTKEKRENTMAKVADVGNAAQDILSLPLELQPAAYAQKQKELLARGSIDPEHAKIPYDIDQLKIVAAGSDHSQKVMEEANKKATAAAAMLRAQAADKAAGKPPAEITDIADYTKTYLAAKGLKDTPSNQLLARQQYYKDKQPYGAQRIQIEQQRADIAENKAAKEDAASVEWKPKVTADEKKKAELAENIAENATAVNAALGRRPDLVGAISGRFTNVEQMIGNNDKDISAIGNRIHNIAMANSGVHGFRSQEGVKETEANILNHFKNGPDAVKGALASNVDSVQTFIDNARPPGYQTHSSQGGAGGYYQKRGTSTAKTAEHVPGGKASGLKEGQTGKGSDGKPYVVKGGVWVPQ